MSGADGLNCRRGEKRRGLQNDEQSRENVRVTTKRDSLVFPSAGGCPRRRILVQRTRPHNEP